MMNNNPMFVPVVPVSDESLRATLKALISACKDSEYGFQEAFSNIHNPNLSQIFRQYSDQRRDFAGELASAAGARGIDEIPAGTMAGAFHRAMFDLRAKVSGSAEAVVLAECERNEDAILTAYDHALGEPLPDSLRRLLQTQYAALRKAHDIIRDLRDDFQQK